MHDRGRLCGRALTTDCFLFLEILPDSQPHVGHGEPGEMGGRSPGKAFCVCERGPRRMLVGVLAPAHLFNIISGCLLLWRVFQMHACACERGCE